MGDSIYDTAWVSMVVKPINGSLTWLFPSSFVYICNRQQENGGWYGNDVIDEIVTALACLLSLKKHEKVEREPFDLPDRIARATTFLNERLRQWDVTQTERIAFELLVPSLLDLLEREGLKFDFPGREKLISLKHDKMSKLKLVQLYKYPSTILYSLEGFIGILDFDKMKHHLQNGSMGSSPASTAAFLMNVSEWNASAETYLTKAVNNGLRYGEGSVPCVYSITIFEFAWVRFRINDPDISPCVI